MAAFFARSGAHEKPAGYGDIEGMIWKRRVGMLMPTGSFPKRDRRIKSADEG
jgi:hypothetical protein